MSLTLSSTDVARYETAVRALLSPLEFSSVEEWTEEVARHLHPLFQTEATMLQLTRRGRSECHGTGAMSELGAGFNAYLAGIEPGAIRVNDPVIDRGFQLCRELGIGAWQANRDDLVDEMGTRLRDTAFYQEVLEPASIPLGFTMTAALPMGESMLSIRYPGRDTMPFAEHSLLLIRMLYPAFTAGAQMLAHLEAGHSAFAHAVDMLDESLLVVDRDGCVLHRNRALVCTLAADEEGERLLAEMRRLADTLCALRRQGSASVDPGGIAAAPEVATALAHYRLRASYAAPDATGRDGGVLVMLERLTPLLPTAQALEERWSLTRREAQVALLLASGQSNKTIAHELGISTHTVRNHAERIFGKLGIHSRNGLALYLLRPVPIQPVERQLRS